MFKSLYFRVILIYLSIVFISVLTGFLSALLLYGADGSIEMESELQEKAALIIDLYERTQPDDLPEFMETAAQLSLLNIELFDAETGETVQFNRGEDTLLSKLDSTVTIPWYTGDNRYQLSVSNDLPEGSGMELTVLLCIILVTGSLLVLVATRYLVKPVKAVTSVANQISTGNFNVRLPEGRQDELGSLWTAINDMADDLGQLESERQEFVANVSHEFQSPLTSIKGFSTMLLNEKLSEEEKRRAAQIIRQESDRLSRLSDNLLKLAALDAGSHAFHPVTFDISEQIRRSVLAFEPQWINKRLQVEMNADKTLLTADEDLLIQVWTNLMSNAVKFTPPGGKISISIQTKREHVEVRFFDSGAPIPVEDRERIFDRFHKTDRTRNRKVDGNGLGLSIVKKIVGLHKGSITVCTTNNDGKSFVVRLPKS
ncbi:Signal transduction histidine kinase [Evansella caseinilytica]|uniref:Heme sensor protein HssS n=1 Tax=Evansella caseinilytica TaxID=1503961 RepID=A0A1H3RLQ0_9BACI|nr:HAMP domain-containing sensor histidine kinase [Evansella caseinilytica]SDZ26171.1 Signal transduction histidine kinase [Evansella caseinilytica]